MPCAGSARPRSADTKYRRAPFATSTTRGGTAIFFSRSRPTYVSADEDERENAAPPRTPPDARTSPRAASVSRIVLASRVPYRVREDRLSNSSARVIAKINVRSKALKNVCRLRAASARHPWREEGGMMSALGHVMPLLARAHARSPREDARLVARAGRPRAPPPPTRTARVRPHRPKATTRPPTSPRTS